MLDQPSSLLISPEVFNQLPSLILISGIAELGSDKSRNISAIQAYLNQSWEKLQQKIADEASSESQRIQLWNESLKRAGISVKNFPPSIKAIAKRALKGGSPFSINPIVDTYNAISMDLALPLGAYDLADLAGHLQLRLSEGGEEFIALGSTENDPTVPGEIVYSDDESILTRMFLWRQSGKGKITDTTKKFIFVCELLDTMEPDLLERAQATIVYQLETLLGANVSNIKVHTRSSSV